MDIEINIFEYEWWKVLYGYLTLFAISIMLFAVDYYFYTDFYPQFNLNLFLTLICIFMFSGFAFISLWISVQGISSMFFVPKLIVFTQNNIKITSPIRGEKIFSYQDMSRFVLFHKVLSRETRELVLLDITMYFMNDSVKVKLYPHQLFNFHDLIETLRSKGLGHLIEEK